MIFWPHVTARALDKCNYLMVLDYLAGALVPSCRHVDDEIDEERVGDEVQVEEEPMPLCQLISRKKWFHEKLIVLDDSP